MFVRALEIGRRICGEDHAANALNHLGIGRCLREQGKVKEAIESYTKAVEIWMHKDPETCLSEMPEVPSQDRLLQLQQQTRTELGQLVIMVGQAQQSVADEARPMEQVMT